MTDTPHSPRNGERESESESGGGSGEESEGVSSETVYEAMESLEPYTTSELATRLDLPKRIVGRLLNYLADEETIRKKAPEPDRAIWIRESPKHDCPECGGWFEVRYFHPIFQAVQFWPRCGTQLRKPKRC